MFPGWKLVPDLRLFVSANPKMMQKGSSSFLNSGNKKFAGSLKMSFWFNRNEFLRAVFSITKNFG